LGQHHPRWPNVNFEFIEARPVIFRLSTLDHPQSLDDYHLIGLVYFVFVVRMHQDQQQSLFQARIIASVAATILSLACGTNVGLLLAAVSFLSEVSNGNS
jgi:hypothetical protein